MAETCCSIGSEAKFWAQTTDDAWSDPILDSHWQFAVNASTMQKVDIHESRQGIRGTRGRWEEDEVLVARDIGGTITMNPAPSDLTWLLPHILGGEFTGNVIPVGDFTGAVAVLGFDWLEKKAGDWYDYQNCRIAKSVFRGNQGGLVELSMDVVATAFDTSVAADNTTAVNFGSFDLADEPLRFGDGVLTIGGSAYSYESFALTIDNVLNVRRMNSLTTTSYCPTDRIITLDVVMCPNAGLWDTTPTAALASTLQFTNGSVSTLFTMGDLFWSASDPTVPGKTLLTIPMSFRALKPSASVAELIVTNDATVA